MCRREPGLACLTPQSAWLRSHDLLEAHRELPGDDEVYRASPLYCALAACPRYSELWSREYKSRVHINVAELDAFLREERRSGARRPCTRLLFGIDSQVTIGCVAKGRSASPRLNQLLEKSIPDVLGSQSYAAPLYFPSHLNPADDPTRGSAVRGPAMETPGWWLRLLEGDPSVPVFTQVCFTLLQLACPVHGSNNSQAAASHACSL